MLNALAADRPLAQPQARISWPAILALHLVPGILTTLLVIAATPFARRAGIPPDLTLVIGFSFIGGPMELGYLFLQGLRRNGRLSLAGIVQYRDRMPTWQFAALFGAVAVYSLGLLFLLMPMAHLIAAHLFWWLPTYMLPSWDPLHAGFGRGTLLAWAGSLLVLDGVVHPIVEEMYFRGHLLPRMLGTMGWPALIVSAVLFAIQHFWQPYNVPMLILIWLVLGPIVVWKRSLVFGIVAHCTGNVLGAVLVLISILGS